MSLNQLYFNFADNHNLSKTRLDKHTLQEIYLNTHELNLMYLCLKG